MPAPTFNLPPSKVIRTPDECFQDVPGFPYVPRYDYFHGLRYAFVDVTSGVFYNGRELSSAEARDAHAAANVRWETYLCLHGEPTWSYLYRRMIPVFLSHTPASSKEYVRRRVLAVDFFGFGRSDKPIDEAFYTWDMHLDFLINFVHRQVVGEAPGRGDVIGVVQDWGGLLGLTLPLAFPSLFTHLLLMNTGLGLGRAPSQGWLRFHDYMKRNPDVKVGALVARGTTHLTPEEIAAYDAPYPNYESKAGVRRFPAIVPREPHMRGVATSYAALAYYNHLLPTDLRVFVAMGMRDPVLGEPVMESVVAGTFSTVGSFVMKCEEAGHFVQEWGEPVARKALDAWAVPKGREGDVRVEGVEWRAPKPSPVLSKL